MIFFNILVFFIHLFQLTCAVIRMKIDIVNEFAKCLTAINTEGDFKSEYLLRMRPVVTSLVTSQQFVPICSATTRFHFARTRNCYVATYFILLSRDLLYLLPQSAFFLYR